MNFCIGLKNTFCIGHSLALGTWSAWIGMKALVIDHQCSMVKSEWGWFDGNTTVGDLTWVPPDHDKLGLCLTVSPNENACVMMINDYLTGYKYFDACSCSGCFLKLYLCEFY